MSGKCVLSLFRLYCKVPQSTITGVEATLDAVVTVVRGVLCCNTCRHHPAGVTSADVLPRYPLSLI